MSSNHFVLDKDKYDGSAIVVAAMNKHITVVRLMLSKGINVDQRDKNGYTALIGALSEGNIDIVNLILKYSPNVNLEDNQGNTPLIVSSSKGYLDIIKTLTENNADVNKCNHAKVTPLIAAAKENHSEVVQFLLDCGADTSKVDDNGSTWLTYASTDMKKLKAKAPSSASQSAAVTTSASVVQAKVVSLPKAEEPKAILNHRPLTLAYELPTKKYSEPETRNIRPPIQDFLKSSTPTNTSNKKPSPATAAPLPLRTVTSVYISEKNDKILENFNATHTKIKNAIEQRKKTGVVPGERKQSIKFHEPSVPIPSNPAEFAAPAYTTSAADLDLLEKLSKKAHDRKEERAKLESLRMQKANLNNELRHQSEMLESLRKL